MADHGIVYLRLGYTETTLLFYYWCTHYSDMNITLFKESQNVLINWLYSTSGFYDKTIVGTYFDFEPAKCIVSSVYQQYMASILNMLTKHTVLTLQFHNLPGEWQSYKTAFLDYISKRVHSHGIYNMSFNSITSKLAGKRVLIVNPMSSLMKQQYESGNVKKITPYFPDLLSIDIIENPYTFFNTGPHSSIFETTATICSEIDTKIFDIAIVSCGAYSSLLADYIKTKHGKDVICIGGILQSMFGIINGRHGGNVNNHWISVPEHLKPVGYMKIERGCYW
jgi:hypothetical protein